MSKGLVIELQRDAMGNSIPASELLRKAMVVARKLKLTELQLWIEKELNGYLAGDVVPDYRKIIGQVSGFNPYHGWQPVIINDSELYKLLTSRDIMQPISELENLLTRGENTGVLTMTFPPEAEKSIMQMTGMPIQPVLRVDRSQVHGAIDAIRSRILDWTLKLEEDGILGENMTFSDEERTKAQSNTQVYINDFKGILGNVSNSNVTQNYNITQNDWQSLEKFLTTNGISKTDAAELKSSLEKDTPPQSKSNFGKAVSDWIGRMVAKAASGAWDISAATAAALLADAIAKYYGLK